MPSILEKLAGGDRKSTGSSEEVSLEVLERPELIEQLFVGIATEDVILRSRCSHALKYISYKKPELLYPYKRQLLEKMARIDQWEVREQFCILFTKLELTRDEASQAFDIFTANLDYYSSIVKTCAMQGLVDLALVQPSLKSDVKPIVQKLTATGTAAMRARGRKLLKVLDKIE